MKVEKKDLEKSQVELNIELSLEELKPYIAQGAEKVSKDVKIEGFRSGKVPYNVLKQKVGEMTILEEAARIAINKTLSEAIKKAEVKQPIGQPKVDITKLAPENPMEYKVVLAVIPSIELGGYKDLKLKSKKVDLKEDETKKLIDNLRDMRVKEIASEEPAKEEDKVVVDIQMYLDKVPVEGGQGKDTAVIVGKDYIVPGFDKKLIGAKKNDVREFSLPYSEDFHMKNLAGKMVEFKVTIKDIFSRVLPELNDEFAVSFGSKNIEDLKVNVGKNILDQKQKEEDQKQEREMLEKILEKAKFGDIPELLLEHEGDVMLSELEQSIAQQGGKFDDYLTSIGKSRDKLVLEMLPEANKRVKTSLIIREIGDKEKIEASEVDVKKQIEDIKTHYKDNKELMAKVDAPEYKSYVHNILSSRKVIDKLREWNIE